jgi:hypothetical protein
MTNKRNLVILGVIVALFLLLSKCSNDRYQQLKGEYSVLEDKYKVQKDGVKTLEKERIVLKDSLENVINNRKDRIVTVTKRIKVLEAVKKDKISKDGLALYYNNRYKVGSTALVNDSIRMEDCVAQEVALELEEGDVLELISQNKDTIIAEQNDIIKGNDLMLFAAEKEIEARKQLEKSAEENINNLKKQNKKLKTKNFFVTVGVAVGAFLIGNYTK